MNERKEKFTLGPCRVQRNKLTGRFDVLDSNRETLATCSTRRDARFFAAAPEMYAELKDLLDAMEKGLFPQPIPGCDYPAVMEKKHELRQLLKKARGEE